MAQILESIVPFSPSPQILSSLKGRGLGRVNSTGPEVHGLFGKLQNY